jgi:hypothetical protein
MIRCSRRCSQRCPRCPRRPHYSYRRRVGLLLQATRLLRYVIAPRPPSNPPASLALDQLELTPAMAAVAGAQPLGGPPLGGDPPLPLYAGPVPPTRICSKRQCLHMLEAPADLKPDSSDYYSQCWRCRGSTLRSVLKRRKIDVTTTGALVQPSAPSMCRQLVQSQSIENLRGAFNRLPASSTSPSLNVGTGSTLSNINVQALVPVPAAAPTLHAQPSPSVSAPPPNPMDVDPNLHTGTSTINESMNFLPRGKDSRDTLEMAEQSWQQSSQSSLRRRLGLRLDKEQFWLD